MAERVVYRVLRDCFLAGLMGTLMYSSGGIDQKVRMGPYLGVDRRYKLRGVNSTGSNDDS